MFLAAVPSAQPLHADPYLADFAYPYTVARFEPRSAPAAAARIRGSQLIAFPELGHSPHIEAPEQFNGALLEALATLPAP